MNNAERAQHIPEVLAGQKRTRLHPHSVANGLDDEDKLPVRKRLKLLVARLMEAGRQIQSGTMEEGIHTEDLRAVDIASTEQLCLQVSTSGPDQFTAQGLIHASVNQGQVMGPYEPGTSTAYFNDTTSHLQAEDYAHQGTDASSVSGDLHHIDVVPSILSPDDTVTFCSPPPNEEILFSHSAAREIHDREVVIETGHGIQWSNFDIQDALGGESTSYIHIDAEQSSDRFSDFGPEPAVYTSNPANEGGHYPVSFQDTYGPGIHLEETQVEDGCGGVRSPRFRDDTVTSDEYHYGPIINNVSKIDGTPFRVISPDCGTEERGMTVPSVSSPESFTLRNAEGFAEDESQVLDVRGIGVEHERYQTGDLGEDTYVTGDHLNRLVETQEEDGVQSLRSRDDTGTSDEYHYGPIINNVSEIDGTPFRVISPDRGTEERGMTVPSVSSPESFTLRNAEGFAEDESQVLDVRGIGVEHERYQTSDLGQDTYVTENHLNLLVESQVVHEHGQSPLSGGDELEASDEYHYGPITNNALEVDGTPFQVIYPNHEMEELDKMVHSELSLEPSMLWDAEGAGEGGSEELEVRGIDVEYEPRESQTSDLGSMILQSSGSQSSLDLRIDVEHTGGVDLKHELSDYRDDADLVDDISPTSVPLLPPSRHRHLVYLSQDIENIYPESQPAPDMSEEHMDMYTYDGDGLASMSTSPVSERLHPSHMSRAFGDIHDADIYPESQPAPGPSEEPLSEPMDTNNDKLYSIPDFDVNDEPSIMLSPPPIVLPSSATIDDIAPFYSSYAAPIKDHPSHFHTAPVEDIIPLHEPSLGFIHMSSVEDALGISQKTAIEGTIPLHPSLYQDALGISQRTAIEGTIPLHPSLYHSAPIEGSVLVYPPQDVPYAASTEEYPSLVTPHTAPVEDANPLHPSLYDFLPIEDSIPVNPTQYVPHPAPTEEYPSPVASHTARIEEVFPLHPPLDVPHPAPIYHSAPLEGSVVYPPQDVPYPASIEEYSFPATSHMAPYPGIFPLHPPPDVSHPAYIEDHPSPNLPQTITVEDTDRLYPSHFASIEDTVPADWDEYNVASQQVPDDFDPTSEWNEAGSQGWTPGIAAAVDASRAYFPINGAESEEFRAWNNGMDFEIPPLDNKERASNSMDIGEIKLPDQMYHLIFIEDTGNGFAENTVHHLNMTYSAVPPSGGSSFTPQVFSHDESLGLTGDAAIEDSIHFNQNNGMSTDPINGSYTPMNHGHKRRNHVTIEEVPDPDALSNPRNNLTINEPIVLLATDMDVPTPNDGHNNSMFGNDGHDANGHPRHDNSSFDNPYYGRYDSSEVRMDENIAGNGPYLKVYASNGPSPAINNNEYIRGLSPLTEIPNTPPPQMHTAPPQMHTSPPRAHTSPPRAHTSPHDSDVRTSLMEELASLIQNGVKSPSMKKHFKSQMDLSNVDLETLRALLERCYRYVVAISDHNLRSAASLDNHSDDSRISADPGPNPKLYEPPKHRPEGKNRLAELVRREAGILLGTLVLDETLAEPIVPTNKLLCTVSRGTAQNFKDERHEGPTIEKFILQLDKGRRTHWNKRAAEVFCKYFRSREGYEGYRRKDIYEAFMSHLTQLKRDYNAQGNEKSIEEKDDEQRARRLARRQTLLQRRVGMFMRIYHYHQGPLGELAKFIRRLTVECMSGDETGTDGKFYKTTVAWRSKELADFLDLLSAWYFSERYLGGKKYSPGEFPRPRYSSNRVDKVVQPDAATKQLPTNWYDSLWLTEYEERQDTLSLLPAVSLKLPDPILREAKRFLRVKVRSDLPLPSNHPSLD
ncbi:hypothetical protein EV360DRAFT_85749 [Lentinula raphanica]|nr:hypothetical protein EV360DRAFT_85749 [Lentinula raphanica]